MKLSAMVGPFLSYCRVQRNHALQTQQKFRDCFHSWLIPTLGDCEVVSVRQADVLRLREAMDVAGLGVARQQMILTVLKMFLGFCRDVLEIECLDPRSIALPKRPRPQVQYLTNEEIGAIRKNINSFTNSGLRLRTLIEVLLTSGMRISEALSLDRDSIDFQKGEAVITGKGGKRRAVFFSRTALNWVKRYLDRRTDLNSALFVTNGDQPRRLRRGDVPRYFKTVAEDAGISKHFTPHLLRHTFCTHLRNNGADISIIKDLAGHADIGTTARYYLAPDKEVLREAVRKYQNYDPIDQAALGS